MKFMLYVGLMAGVFISGCNQKEDPDFDRLAAYMCGSFSSEEQSKTDTNFYDVRIEMIRIWKNIPGQTWIYVEQAYGDQTEKPYRQRVYRLSRTSDTTFESKVYEIASPLRFAGEWKNSEPLSGLTPDSLTARQGCAMIIKKQVDNSGFYGTTPGKECTSARKGASYAISEFSLTENVFTTWERGFDANDKQVWGSEHGGYVFKKIRNYPVQ